MRRILFAGQHTACREVLRRDPCSVTDLRPSRIREAFQRWRAIVGSIPSTIVDLRVCENLLARETMKAFLLALGAKAGLENYYEVVVCE